MRKRKRLVITALVFVLACPTFGAPQGREPQLFLVFVDDLHLDFRSTPRLRELTKKVMRLLIQDGDRLALVTTGYSSVAVAPTSDSQQIISGLSRITGGGLRADQNVDPEQGAERTRRATIAIATARDAVRVMASKANGPFAVLYFSGGYAGQSVEADLFELVSDAFRASAVIYAFAPRLVGGPMPPPSVGNESAWDAYERAAQDSLRNLAGSTGGQLVSSIGEFDSALAQIARTANQ
jgi:hypothetical protein